MSDLETRLSESLAGTAGRAPHPSDLASGARLRLRRRRRTTRAIVAGSLAVVAIPVGIAVVGSQDGGSDRRETTVGEPVPADWRVETWRDLTLRVPPGWSWGSGTDWCSTDSSAATATPVVSRPGRFARALGCAPTYAYGVHFFEPSGGELPPGTEGAVQQYRGRRYPYGAWLGYTSTGRAAVWVVTDSRQLTRQVLDSTEPVGEVDANGCAVRVESVATSVEQRMSVCHYARDAWLEQSELLTRSDSRLALEALRSGSVPNRSADRVCAGQLPEILMSAAGFVAEVSMSLRWVRVDGQCRFLTTDMRYWAVPPGAEGAMRAG